MCVVHEVMFLRFVIQSWSLYLFVWHFLRFVRFHTNMVSFNHYLFECLEKIPTWFATSDISVTNTIDIIFMIDDKQR